MGHLGKPEANIQSSYSSLSIPEVSNQASPLVSLFYLLSIGCSNSFLTFLTYLRITTPDVITLRCGISGLPIQGWWKRWTIIVYFGFTEMFNSLFAPCNNSLAVIWDAIFALSMTESSSPIICQTSVIEKLTFNSLSMSIQRQFEMR